MSFLPYEAGSAISAPESFHNDAVPEPFAASAMLHIARQKLCIPNFKDATMRPRVIAVLKNSVEHFPATIVCGRSGTGKTAAVASLALTRKRVAWNSLEPPDIHWASFANSTLASLRGNKGSNSKTSAHDLVSEPDTKDISRFVDRIFTSGRGRRDLLVLDNIHYVFDTVWFREFFELLLPAIPDARHMILISRSKPPFPLWRVRSKQFLNLIDEKVFAFDEAETIELFGHHGYSPQLAAVARKNCFGKVAHMLRFAEAAAELQ